MKAGIEDLDFDWSPDDIPVLRNAGPQGGPGMPEWGMLPIPAKLVKQGVRDMVRLFRRAHERHELLAPASCHVAPGSHKTDQGDSDAQVDRSRGSRIVMRWQVG
jgi:hypothetical protein